jgi:hypothetical protein
MGLFSKPKVPGIDVGALSRIAEQNANTQRDILGRKKQALAPLQEKLRTDRAQFAAGIQPAAEQLLQQNERNVQGLGQQQVAANQAAGIAQREQSFRDVPAIQRSIRESLGGSGLLRSGVASQQLARPIIDAARSSRDFTSGLETERLGDEVQRSEGLASTGFNVRQAALSKKLGIDEETMNQLAEMGRTDLIDEFNALAGIESDLGQSRLGLEQLSQTQKIEQAKAKAARKGQILSTLGSLAGGAAGFMAGGPMGAGVGAQAGGALGNLAGGGSGGQIDPTLLFALMQQRQNKPTFSARNPVEERFAAQYRTGGF